MAEMKLINSHRCTKTSFVRSGATVSILFLSLSFGSAENVITLGYRPFTNVFVISNYSSVVMINCNDGVPDEKKVDLLSLCLTSPDADYSLLKSHNNDDHLIIADQSGEYETNYSSYPIQVRSWDLSISGTRCMFFSHLWKGTNYEEILRSITQKRITFELGSEKCIDKVFSDFNERSDIAAKNSAKPFKRKILDITNGDISRKLNMFDTTPYTFGWSYSGASLIVGDDDMDPTSFDKEDVIHFQQLLSKLPQLKEELVQKIHKAESQQILVK